MVSYNWAKVTLFLIKKCWWLLIKGVHLAIPRTNIDVHDVDDQHVLDNGILRIAAELIWG